MWEDCRLQEAAVHVSTKCGRVTRRHRLLTCAFAAECEAEAGAGAECFRIGNGLGQNYHGNGALISVQSNKLMIFSVLPLLPVRPHRRCSFIDIPLISSVSKSSCNPRRWFFFLNPDGPCCRGFAIMVGVPGRSKACSTCRRRKKGVRDSPGTSTRINVPFVVKLI
jgi:hypothetical protein